MIRKTKYKRKNIIIYKFRNQIIKTVNNYFKNNKLLHNKLIYNIYLFFKLLEKISTGYEIMKFVKYTFVKYKFFRKILQIYYQ